MVIAAIITLLSTFYLGFSLGKHFIARGLTLRAFQMIEEGDTETGNVFLRLLKEKNGENDD